MSQLGLRLGHADAMLSPCGRYRYALWRRWDDGPQVLFVMLNPSTADASEDDPTIRRCIGFGRSWGFGALAVGNLFAWRATDPRRLREAPDPVGAENDARLSELIARSDLVVAAWGTGGAYLGRDRIVRGLCPRWHCLGRTKHGHPRHPLYCPAMRSALEWPS